MINVFRKKGFNWASRCSCCSNPQCKSINHVFIKHEVAKRVWADFEGRMGIGGNASLLQLKLSAWWMAKVRSTCHKAIFSLIPTCICWELWLNWNRSKFDNKRLMPSQLIANVESNLTAILLNHSISLF